MKSLQDASLQPKYKVPAILKLLNMSQVAEHLLTKFFKM